MGPVQCIASSPLSCFMCGTHKRHQRLKLQPKEHENKRHIRSDLRVAVRATAIILVGVDSTSSGSIGVGGSNAGPRPVFEERVNQTRLRCALKQREPVLRACGMIIHAVRDPFVSAAHHASQNVQFTHSSMSSSPVTVLVASLLVR